MIGIQKYLTDNGFIKSGAPYFSTVSANGLYQYYTKGDTTIIYGIIEYGRRSQLYVYPEMIRMSNNIIPCIEDVMSKMEWSIDNEVLMNAFISMDVIFDYDYLTDEFTITKLDKPIERVTFPVGIVFEMAANEQGITVI